jgi:hypothetical protein
MREFSGWELLIFIPSIIYLVYLLRKRYLKIYKRRKK